VVLARTGPNGAEGETTSLSKPEEQLKVESNRVGNGVARP